MQWPTFAYGDRIRITDATFESFAQAIVHSIEFQYSVPGFSGPIPAGQPHPILATHVVHDVGLGGVHYVACATHDKTVSDAIQVATEAFRKHQKEHRSRLTLQIKVGRLTKNNSLFFLSALSAPKRTPVALWEFKFQREASEIASSRLTSGNLMVANDPVQMREMLHFIVDKALTMIDSGFAEDLALGPLLYDAEVLFV